MVMGDEECGDMETGGVTVRIWHYGEGWSITVNVGDNTVRIMEVE